MWVRFPVGTMSSMMKDSSIGRNKSMMVPPNLTANPSIIFLKKGRT